MARAKKGTPAGRSSSIKGTKSIFFENFKDEFLEAQKADPGLFYDRVTSLYLLRYGFDLPFNEDVGGTEIPEEDIANRIDAPGLPEVEIERRKAFRKDVRVKIAQWFRHKYTFKKTTKSAVFDFLKSLSDAPMRPRKQNPVNLYSSLYYKGGPLQAKFQDHWNEAKDTVPASERLAMCKEFVRKAWWDESEEFRAEVNAQATKNYEDAMVEYKKKAGRSRQGSAQDYHDALESADEVLVPIVDAIAERFGLYVVIMMTGPIGAEGGEVGVRSVHSDTSGRSTNKIWPLYDHNGFTQAAASLCRYGQAFFTKEECIQRIVSSDAAPSFSTDHGVRDQTPTSQPLSPALPSTVTQQLDFPLDPTLLNPMQHGPFPSNPDLIGQPPQRSVPPLDNGTPLGPIEQGRHSALAQTASSRPNASNDSRSHNFAGANVGNERAEGGDEGMNSEECGSKPGAESSGDGGGNVGGDVGGDVHGDVGGDVHGDVGGDFGGDSGGVDGGEANAGDVDISNHAGELGRRGVDGGSGGGNIERGGGEKDGGGLNVGALHSQNPDGRPEEPPLSNPSPTVPQGPPGSDVRTVRSLRNTMDRSGLPDVVDRAFDYFTEGKEWGPSWARCVAAWVTFERTRAFKTTGKLPTSSRPPEVGVWMKNARPWVDMHVGDEFPEQCEAWWNDLQPRNRQAFDRREDVTDWGVLNTAGPCGVMLILLVLTWWRYIRQSEGSWESVVEDVTWVLERMRDCEPVTKGSKGSKKRDQPSESSERDASGSASTTRSSRKRQAVGGSTGSATPKRAKRA